MAVNTTITPFTHTPSRQNPATFSSDMDSRLSEENARITQMNAMSSEINSTETNINAKEASAVANANTTTTNMGVAITAKNDAITAKNEAISAKNAITGYVVPESATYTYGDIDIKNSIQNDANFNAYGYTQALTVESRFLETTTPNVIVDKVSEPVRFSDGLYERTANSQATLPVAPFAPTSTDELLDDKVNGLTCQIAHSKGDIVVTGNELVTNGTFDTDVSGWTKETGWTIDGGVASVATSSQFAKISQLITTVVGQEYIIYSDVTAIASAQLGLYVRANTTSGATIVSNTAITTAGRYTLTFTATTTTTAIFLSTLLATGTASIDNISVKLKDNIYQATVDSPSSALTSSDWQVLPQVTRQDVITLRKHKTTKAVDYHTFKGTKYFGEGYSQKDVMSYYGYSQVDKNLWEDATYEYVFVGLKNSLNAGAYHPVYNTFGTAYVHDPVSTGIQSWWVGNITSMLDCFTPAPYTTSSITGYVPTTGQIGGIASPFINTYWARPDGLFYDKVYLDNYGGLITSSKYLAYAGKEMHRLLDSESNDLLSESWLEGTDELLTYNTTTTVEDLTDTSKTVWNLSKKAISVYQVLYTTDSGVTWGTQSFTFNSVTNQITLGTSRTDIKVSYKSANQSALQSDPQKVLQVQPKAIASNSHSVYKGAMMTYAGTGKVAVGNGSNGLESRSLENDEFYNEYISDYAVVGGYVSVATGEVMLIIDAGFTEVKKGEVWERVGSNLVNGLLPPSANIASGGNWKLVGFVTTPTHNTISLDNSNSPATKWFTTLAEMEDGELAIQTFSEEMVSNSGAYDGDNQEFNKLTNGTDTDLNNKTVQTKCLVKRLGVYNG